MDDTTRRQGHVVAASYLGWTLDAFDFFIMVFVLRDIAATFSTSNLAVSWAITLTLAMRPLGAFIFGRIADRFGRRPTLMADVICYSFLEFASGFAPSLTVFIVLRALYGIAMGGEWGVGASLTMESIPARWRGTVSGLLQAGYPSGYLLASILYLAVPVLGWRGMFMVGAVPALLVLYIRRNVPESPDWRTRSTARELPPIGAILRRHVGLAIYAVVMMAAFNFFSHGTQDIYPSLFLGGQHHLPHATISTIAITYNIGAILGGLGFGTLSQVIGRRAAIVSAALLSLPVLPLWAFSSDPVYLGLGAFLMQICVQGAWGVIPAHLNELSPPEIRGTFPGFVYQLGNLLAAGNATIQTAIADRMNHDYRFALAGVAGIVAVVIAVMVAFGREAREVRMGRDLLPEAPDARRAA
jgi:MFS transporter, SHS family, lactate transporter